MRIFLYIFLLLIVIAGVTFSYINATPVVLHYFVGQASMPLSLLLVLTLGVGILLGILSLIIPLLRVKSKNASLQRKLKNSQSQP